jgi:hypothetical protein
MRSQPRSSDLPASTTALPFARSFDLMDSSGAMQIGPFEVAEFVAHVLHDTVDVEAGDAATLIEALDYDGDGRVSFTDLLDAIAFVKKNQDRLQCRAVRRATKRPILRLAAVDDDAGSSTRTSPHRRPAKRPRYMWPLVVRWLLKLARPACMVAVGVAALRFLWRLLVSWRVRSSSSSMNSSSSSSSSTIGSLTGASSSTGSRLGY